MGRLIARACGAQSQLKIFLLLTVDHCCLPHVPWKLNGIAFTKILGWGYHRKFSLFVVLFSTDSRICIKEHDTSDLLAA